MFPQLINGHLKRERRWQQTGTPSWVAQMKGEIMTVNGNEKAHEKVNEANKEMKRIKLKRMKDE
jgi:hypothetical protein